MEALLDFRVHTATEGTETERRLHDFAEAVRADYPTEVERAAPDSAPAALRTFLRFDQRRLRSDDGTRSVLVGANRLTFSATFNPPDRVYTSWRDELEGPAFHVWAMYEQTVRPDALVSLATRFVNRFYVRTDRPAEVLESRPELPIPNAVLSSFNDRRSGRTLDDYGVQVGRRLGVRPDGATRAVLFVDVEAFRRYDEPLALPVDRAALAGDLARLHTLKNDLFYGSLTSDTLHQYRDDDA